MANNVLKPPWGEWRIPIRLTEVGVEGTIAILLLHGCGMGAESTVKYLCGGLVPDL